jgi:membrane protease YdiL (CAAX protease family)
MGKNDILRKLSSRKFWALLAALATSVLTASGAGDNTVLHVTGVIGAVGACVAYMLAEGIADGARNSGGDKTEQ